MYQRILVPVDGSSTSGRGLEEAVNLARLTGGSLRLIHVVDTLSLTTGLEPYSLYSGDAIPRLKENGEQLLEHARAQAVAGGVQADTLLFDRSAMRVSETVVEQATAWRADLIVLGTHGRRGVGRLLLGSDAEQILRMAPVPVLLVRSPEVPAVER